MKKGYESVHSVKEHMYDLADYREDEDEVLSFLKKVDPAKHVQVARFVKDCDTKEILPRLPNKTLIISGKKDVLMPLALGEEMHNLLKNSQLLVTEGNHYKVLDKQGFEELDKFLV